MDMVECLVNNCMEDTMTKDEYEYLKQPGIPLNSATREAMKRYESERRWNKFVIGLTIFLVVYFAWQFSRHLFNG